MRLEQFIVKYIGNKIDYDGRYGAQCVDLYRQYCAEVLNIPHTGGVQGAIDLWTLYESGALSEKRYFTKHENTPDFIPLPGDIAVFKPVKGNPYGHVCVVVFASVHAMAVFEQDGFAQDGAKMTTRAYKNIAGFLRPR